MKKNECFYFYSDSYTGLKKSQVLFLGIFYNYDQAFIS